VPQASSDDLTSTRPFCALISALQPRTLTRWKSCLAGRGGAETLPVDVCDAFEQSLGAGPRGLWLPPSVRWCAEPTASRATTMDATAKLLLERIATSTVAFGPGQTISQRAQVLGVAAAIF